jgi:arylsulfatase A-like enzyme/Flp pilus assembly protein TadD
VRRKAHGVVRRLVSAYDVAVSRRDLVILLLASCVLAHCACSSEESQSTLRPNVLLITLDTTRADRLGCYGYDNAQTPNIDELAATGVLFENAICQAPLTLPSHASILTGTQPPLHGVRDNGGFYLEDRFVTLAEVLRDQSYATSAFVGAFVLDSRWGLAQGFDVYDDNFGLASQRAVALDAVQRRGDEAVEAFLGWLDNHVERDFFSWIHFYDPHTPYAPPEPFRTAFSDREWGLYDGEIAYVDSLIGLVVEELRRRSVLDETLIVIVGDHGESLGQHGESGHGFFVYDATLRVPLIIRFPSSRHGGKKVSSSVETVDILPTLLRELDLPIPQDVQGESLLPLVRDEDRARPTFSYFETYFPLYRYGWSGLAGVRSERYKLIRAPQPELFDLEKDPGEQTNVYEQYPEVAAELEKELAHFDDENAVQEPRLVDDESLSKLAALGYLGGFTSSSRSDVLADPKNKIRIFNRIRQAEERFTADDLDNALSAINEVIQEDPAVPQARQVRAQIYMNKDRLPEAIEDCRAALKSDPEYKAALFTLAHAHRLEGEYGESIAVYKRLMSLEPKDYKPPLNLGKIYLEQGDIDSAVSYLKLSIRLDPERSAMAHNLLGAAYLQQGRLAEAEQEIKTAIELRPWIKDAHYNLGLLCDRRGDTPGAVRELQAEVDLYPDSHMAHFHLARLFEQLGDHERKIEHLQKVIEYKDDFARVYLMLGKAYLDANKNLDEALGLTQKGLELDPGSEFASFGHFVLADIYLRLGDQDRYRAEKEKGEQLQRKLEAR